jgi:hypothetical protein
MDSVGLEKRLLCSNGFCYPVLGISGIFSGIDSMLWYHRIPLVHRFGYVNQRMHAAPMNLCEVFVHRRNRLFTDSVIPKDSVACPRILFQAGIT